MLVGRPTESLSITAGVRHDDHRDFGGATTFAVDAGQKLGDLVTLRASYREGFKAPTLYQLSDTAGAYGNPGLLPERAPAHAVGLSVGTTPGLFLDVAAFRRHRTHPHSFFTFPHAPAPPPPPSPA